MEGRLSFITLGVADLERSKAFYSDVLGWRAMHESEGIVMYRLNGLVLSLFPQEDLMADARVKEDGRGSRFTLAHCVRSAQEVDALFAHLLKHGVAITKLPEKVFWGGYSGYFADPDGHLWEVAHNPFLELDERGDVLGMRMG